MNQKVHMSRGDIFFPSADFILAEGIITLDGMERVNRLVIDRAVHLYELGRNCRLALHGDVTIMENSITIVVEETITGELFSRVISRVNPMMADWYHITQE